MLARRGEVSPGGSDHAGLALDRLEHDRGASSVTAARSAVASPNGTKVDLAGQRLERLAVGSLGGERQRAHGPAVEAPSVATMWVRPVRRVILKAASLASVPELVKNTRVPCRASAQREQPLGQRDLRLGVAKKFDTCPSVCSCARSPRRPVRVGVAERR